MMRALIADVQEAAPEARREASRELWITILVSLSAFFLGPLVYSFVSLPWSAAGSFFGSFFGADVFIAAVSLLSISIYSISKEYNVQGQQYFAFPHASTITISAFLIGVFSSAVYTARILYEASPGTYGWRPIIAALVGIIVFSIACMFAYAVLTLRNNMEIGSGRTMRNQQEEFVEDFAHERAAEQPAAAEDAEDFAAQFAQDRSAGDEA